MLVLIQVNPNWIYTFVHWIFILPVSNDTDGVAQALKEIKKHNPSRIIIEATGRLEFNFI